MLYGCKLNKTSDRYTPKNLQYGLVDDMKHRPFHGVYYLNRPTGFDLNLSSISPPVFLPCLSTSLHWSYLYLLFPLFSCSGTPTFLLFLPVLPSLPSAPSSSPSSLILSPFHCSLSPEVSSILRKESHVQLLNQANKTLLSLKK